MIFTTIEKDVDSVVTGVSTLGNKMGILGASFKDILATIQQDGFKGLGNLFASTDMRHITEADLSKLKNFQEVFAVTGDKAEAMATTMVGASRGARDLANSAEYSADGLKNLDVAIRSAEVSEKSYTLATVGAKVATVAFQAALSFGLAIAIQAVVSGLQYLIHYQEKQAEAAHNQAKKSQEAADKANEEAKSLDELISKYKDLKSSENFDNTTREEIKKIQEEITRLVGDQANNLDLVNGKLDDELEKLKNASQEMAKQNLSTYRTAAADAMDEPLESTEGKLNYEIYAKSTDELYDKFGKTIFDMFNKAVEDSGNKWYEQKLSYNPKVPIVMDESTKQQLFVMGGDNGNVEIDMDKITYLNRQKAVAEVIDYLEENLDDVNDSDLYRQLSRYKSQLDTFIQERQTKLESFVVTDLISGNYSKTNISSLEDYKALRQSIIDDLEKDSTIQDALKKGFIEKDWIEKQADDYLSGLSQFSTYYEQFVNETKQTSEKASDAFSFTIDDNELKSQIDDLKDSISDIVSAYSDMMSIIDDYNENGNLSVDNLEKLIELDDDYIGTLFNENGELELNKDSYIALAKAKLEDIRYSMLEKAISEINSLKKEDETVANQSLAESTGNLTEATLQLVAAQKLAEGYDSTKINAIMQTYYQWNVLIDNVIAGLENNTNATLGVSDATDEATDSTNDYKDALEAEKDALEDAKDALQDQKNALEDIKDGYEDAIDSIKELIDWVQDYIKQIKNNEIDALEEKKNKIDDLIESQKDLLNAEKDEYEWNKKIAEKNNTVASDALAASIASLDDSSAGKKAQKQANEKLAESRTDIIDTLYEHSIDERLDALDELKEEQDDYYDEQIDKIQDYLNNEVQLYKDACNMIDTDSGELYGKLLWYCQNYTTTSEAEFNYMWNSAQSAMQQYNTANLGTFDLLNNLQGRIYEVDTAIDEMSRSISEYESAIDAVQEKIDNLGDTAEDTINKINSIKATKVQGSWYVEYRGKKYSSFFDNKSDAINDLRKQVTQSVPFNELNPLLINNGTVKHYASGTHSAKSGIAQINENGLETLMRKTPDGDFVIMNQDDQVYTKKQTDNLYDFASDPEKFLSEKGLSPLSQEELANLGLWGDSSQLGMINSAFGVGGLSGLIEKITGGSGVTSSSATTNNIAPVVNITIQGDATQSTVNALHAEAENIVQRARNAAHNDFIETVLKGRKWR